MQSVSSDEEIGKNAARTGISLASPASHVLLEGTPCIAPSGFIEIPVHRNTHFLSEGIKEGFRRGGAASSSAQ